MMSIVSTITVGHANQLSSEQLVRPDKRRMGSNVDGRSDRVSVLYYLYIVTRTPALDPLFFSFRKQEYQRHAPRKIALEYGPVAWRS